jgi:hypothetical protein
MNTLDPEGRERLPLSAEALDELEALYEAHYGDAPERCTDRLARAIRQVLTNNGRPDPATASYARDFIRRQTEHAEDIRWYLSNTAHPADRPRAKYGVRTSLIRPLP